MELFYIFQRNCFEAITLLGRRLKGEEGNLEEQSMGLPM